MEVGDSHSFPRTTSDPTCVDNFSHHYLDRPHAQDDLQDYSVVQFIEGSNEMESNCRELASHQEEPHERFHQEEPHERFEHEENSDLQVFVKGGDIEYIGQTLVANNDEEYSTMG